jgi:hypothetical protein
LIRPTSGAASLTEFPGPLGGVGNVNFKKHCQVRNTLLMAPLADRDRCLHQSAGRFCIIRSFCRKIINKISLESGILNIQYILNQTYLTWLIFLFLEILSTLAFQDTTLPWFSSYFIGPFLLFCFAH